MGRSFYFVAIVQLIFQAKIKDMRHMSADAMWWMVITYVVFTHAWMVNIIHRSQTIPKEKE
jgi:hypothetical protein